MSDWPVGLSTGCFYQMSIFDVLEDIQKSGISVIEICSYPPHLDYHDVDAVSAAAERIQQLGLEPFSFHAPFADEIDITSLNDEQRSHSLNEILQAAKAAATLGVMHFVIHPGPEQEGKPPPEEHLRRMQNAAEALNKVSAFCHKARMSLTLENMLRHLLFGHTSDLLWIMGAIDQRNVGICLDTGHANLSGDLDTVMYKLSGHLKMVHAADNKGHRDDHLPPGKGYIDWHKLISKLNQTRFQGGFILEISGDMGKSVHELLSDAQQARQLIWDISRKIEIESPL